jgi:recombinational DNA repair protein (RecF pathway)
MSTMTCILCRASVPLDDACAASPAGVRCICLRCWTRETGAARRLPRRLVRELEEILAHC